MAGFLEALGLKKRKVDPSLEAGAAEYDARRRAEQAQAQAQAQAGTASTPTVDPNPSPGLAQGNVDPSLVGAIGAVKKRKALLDSL
jgi:hypothetical protein